MTTTKELLAQKKRLDKAYKEAREASIKTINDYLRTHAGEKFTTNELAKIGEIPVSVICGSHSNIRAKRCNYHVIKYYIEVTEQGDIINPKIQSKAVTRCAWYY